MWNESVGWVLHFAGRWDRGRMSVEWQVVSEDGDRMAGDEGLLVGRAESSSFVAEWEAALAGLRWVAQAQFARIERLTVRGESELVAEVANGNWTARKPHIAALANECHALVSRLAASGVAVVFERVV